MLGVTSYSKVYLVRHITLDVLRVAKVIRKADKDADSILKEARLIKNLKHPHIPIIYDIEDDDISICIIEEYIAGKSLRKYLQEKQGISINQICDIGIKLCDILEYLHNCEEGIIHLDIKPDNIMIDDNNNVKLIDFGNASSSKEIVSSGMVSPFYAAPEQYQESGLTEKTDIYSVGIILMFMAEMSGSYSKEKSNPYGTGIYNRDLKFICHNRLYPIIKKCTRHRAESRYQDVRALKKALEKLNKKTAFKTTKNSNKKCRLEYNHSYVIKVSGTRRGIGVTHTVLSMAYTFAQQGISCVVIENTKRNSILNTMLSGNVDNEGIFTHKGVNFLVSAAGIDNKCAKEHTFEVMLVDNGTEYDKDNIIIDSIMQNNTEIINVIVAGGKYDICTEINMISAICDSNAKKSPLLMLNLLNELQFYSYSNYMPKGVMCYRIPCVYSWCEKNDIWFQSMNDFMQDNLSSLWESLKVDRKKERKDLIYEKLWIIMQAAKKGTVIMADKLFKKEN